MKQHAGGAIAFLGLLLCLCESDNLMLYLICGSLGVVLMAIGAGISGAYITNKKMRRSTTCCAKKAAIDSGADARQFNIIKLYFLGY